jgi:uncharacterized protein (DUF1499 family)
MTRPDALGYARGITLAAAVLAVAMILASGPGTRAGWWEWQTGIFIVRAAFFLGAAVLVAALALLALFVLPRFRVHAWIPLAALVLGLVAVLPPLLLLSKAKAVPAIHDITTDPADPPAFVGLAAVRRAAPNGFDYGGATVAAQQRTAYPDIKPLVVKAPPREVVQRAIDAARGLGWEVASSDAAAGRVEATETTFWFGFKDDVVIRIRPEGEGSRVDVRSVSRVGGSDLGANAARIRKFLDKIS